MKRGLLLIVIIMLTGRLSAQNVYTIKADSVKLTGCDSSELIIENHTQGVPGFLYNTGHGKTVFKRGVVKINDSLYLIGGDTLNLRANAWIQGGNRFGTTGVLGTLDNNNLDLYTNNTQRARLTNSGNFLLGTTIDTGNKLQVNGAASFSGNVGIGSASITYTGNLLGTNAILFNHFISQNHNYEQVSPFVSKLDNILYNYSARFTTTTTTGTDGTITIDMVIPSDEILTGYGGLVYPNGWMYFSFWNGGIPQSVSVQMKNSSGGWYGPFSSSTNICPNGVYGFFQIGIPEGFNYLTEIKIAITPLSPGAFINLQNIEYVLINSPGGLVNPLPFVGKYGAEHVYNYFFLKNAGADNVRLSPYLSLANYFLNNVLVGTSSDNGNKLQVTGNATVTGSVGIGTGSPGAQLHTTGSVRFAGLTNDSTQTRVLVSDASGNLYYRSASSLAMDAILHATLAKDSTINSSLAVNGEITARKLRLKQTGWPDYVFASDYSLLPLSDLEQYIRQQGHLPGISSAVEVGEKGVDVGENQAALLKKIEELTLYSIAQEKELESLRREMTELKTLIATKLDK